MLDNSLIPIGSKVVSKPGCGGYYAAVEMKGIDGKNHILCQRCFKMKKVHPWKHCKNYTEDPLSAAMFTAFGG